MDYNLIKVINNKFKLLNLIINKFQGTNSMTSTCNPANNHPANNLNINHYFFFESERIKTQRFPINSRKNYALIRIDSDFRESSLAKKGLN